MFDSSDDTHHRCRSASNGKARFVKFLVLIKEVPDTWGDRRLDVLSGRIDREGAESVVDEIGERALEVALSYRDIHKDTEIVALSMGPDSIVKSLRKCLAMGATSALHLVDTALAGADLLMTARALAAAIRREGFDVVLTGNESTDGRGGALPAMIAELLGVPQLTFANSVEFADGQVRCHRATETGSVELCAALPAVVSITEAMPDARFPNLKGLMTAKKKPIRTVVLEDLALGAVTPGRSTVLLTAQRPARAGGVKVFDTGNAGNDLADFLVDKRLL